MLNKKLFIKICPQCGSVDTTIPPRGLDLKMTYRDYCRKCRNKGIFPEVEIGKIEEFQKEVKKCK